MALQQISDTGILSWVCTGEGCGNQITTHYLDERVAYQQSVKRARDGFPRAVIALPACPECERQTALHADYTRRDILRLNVLKPVVNDIGLVQGFVMHLPHVRNLLLHHLLHQAGRIPHAPLLPLLPEQRTLHPWLQSLSRDVAHAFWFPYSLIDIAAQVPFEEYLMGLHGGRPLPP